MLRVLDIHYRSVGLCASPCPRCHKGLCYISQKMLLDQFKLVLGSQQFMVLLFI